MGEARLVVELYCGQFARQARQKWSHCVKWWQQMKQQLLTSFQEQLTILAALRGYPVTI